MAFIEGSNNPGNRANVTNAGQIRVASETTTGLTEAAVIGTAYNINSAPIVLSTDAETPIAYFKNTFEVRDIIIDNVLLCVGVSTGGSGHMLARVVSAPSNGTIITAGVPREVANLNLASTKPLNVIANLGGTGLTSVGGNEILQYLLPSDSSEYDLHFNSIVLPRGSDFVLLLTPPNGNTSMVVQTGFALYLREEN